MAEDSAIEWCDHTFNPWWGCVKTSEGCKNCYAEARQWGGDWWGKEKPRRFFGEKHWNQPIKWNKKAGKLGIRYKVFCGSYCDVFEEREGLEKYRARLLSLIERTTNLDWLLLTKRPENINRTFWFIASGSPNNLWLGVSVENQKQADIRIPHLLKIPAKVRFLSCEPLLEKILLDNGETSWITCDGKNKSGLKWDHICCESEYVAGKCFHGVDWVIVGGESGQNARPMHPEWARSIRNQCQEAGVSFFMKQMNKIDPIPDDLFIRQFPEVA